MINCPFCGAENDGEHVRREEHGEIHTCVGCGEKFVLTPDGELISVDDL